MKTHPKKQQETTKSIILRHQAGDLTAFPALVARYAGFLMTYCLRYHKDRDDAKDDCQEIWIIVLDLFLHNKYTDTGNFEGWLRVTAFRYLYKKIDDEKKMPMLHDIWLYESSDELSDWEILNEEQLVIIEKMLPKLPERWRLLIKLRLFQKESWDEIANIINKSNNTPGKEKAKSLSKEYSRIMVELLKRFFPE